TQQDALFQARRHRPQVIIADVFLSELDDAAREGIEFCSRIKSDAELFYIPVITYSASRQRDVTVESAAYSAGAHAYFRKPYPQESLKRFVDKLVTETREVHERLSSMFMIPPRLRTLYQSAQLSTELRLAVISSVRANNRIHNSLKLLLGNCLQPAEFYETIEALRKAVETGEASPDVVIVAVPDQGMRMCQ